MFKWSALNELAIGPHRHHGPLISHCFYLLSYWLPHGSDRGVKQTYELNLHHRESKSEDYLSKKDVLVEQRFLLLITSLAME